ncbi:hypothetical protein, partial [Ruegeria sp. HKCCD8929]|uniref:hypothetical protein n=1 Tax=Ruegeria sp. HKCCD8929 TaxID=2683006 RepID=UPI001C2CA120
RRSPLVNVAQTRFSQAMVRQRRSVTIQRAAQLHGPSATLVFKSAGSQTFYEGHVLQTDSVRKLAHR